MRYVSLVNQNKICLVDAIDLGELSFFIFRNKIVNIFPLDREVDRDDFTIRCPFVRLDIQRRSTVCDSENLNWQRS